MLKFIVATIVAIILFSLVPVNALASPNLLQAETGVTLPPSGLEFTGGVSFGYPGSPFDLQLSYGAFPSVTVVGEFTNQSLFPVEGSASNGGDGARKLVKVLWSPKHKDQGYTVYLGYEMDRAFIPFYGVSLWADYKYLLAFVNLQTTVASVDGVPVTPVTVTPGVSLKFGSKLQVGGEVEVKPGDWRTQKLRLGMDYALFQRIRAKLTIQTDLNNLIPDFTNPIYQTGFTFSI
ncbi:MAG TPA: hypothetical protein VHY08_28020 [Bacillota bacterium]|nr:hypothetical protein [Bacillota bacterium]